MAWTRSFNGDPPASHLAKAHVGFCHVEFGRPHWYVQPILAPLLSSFHMQLPIWFPKVFRVRRPLVAAEQAMALSYKSEGRDEIRDIHTLHLQLLSHILERGVSAG